MRAWHIDNEQPQRRKQQKRREFHPVSNCSGDQRDGDDCEGHLVHHEQRFGDCLGQRADAFELHAGQEDARQVAEIGRIAAESEGIGKRHPKHRNQRRCRQALAENRQDVLTADHAGVKQRQPGDGHHQHQRGGDDHEAGIGRIDFRRGCRGSLGDGLAGCEGAKAECGSPLHGEAITNGHELLRWFGSSANKHHANSLTLDSTWIRAKTRVCANCLALIWAYCRNYGQKTCLPASGQLDWHRSTPGGVNAARR